MALAYSPRMSTPTPPRQTPLSLSPEITLRNRVVIPPMASGTADLSGFVTPETVKHYARLGKASAGLLIAEYSFVHLSGKSEALQLGVNLDEQVPGLKKIAAAIHHSGAVAGLQLTHAGGKTERCFSGGVLHSPSGIRVPVKDRTLEIPTAMSTSDIYDWKAWFIAAADRAVKSDFDVVELHAAHGYGLNQWLSPLTNKRTDEFGGSLKKNARLLLDIVKEIRSQHPPLLLSVRLPGQDFMDGGLTISASIFLAQELQTAGVHVINVSSGIGGWRRPGARLGEGYLIEEAAVIQRHTAVPVIGVGGIETGAFIDELVRANRVSLAAVGRAILKDPETWGKEQLHGGACSGLRASERPSISTATDGRSILP